MSPNAHVVLWKLRGDESEKVAELFIPLRDALECGLIQYRDEYYALYRLQDGALYFLLAGGILKVD